MGVLVIYLSILLAATVMVTNSSKILILPTNFGSHINIFTTLGKALLDDHHEVWVLTYDRFKGTVEKKGLTPLTFPVRPEDDLFEQTGRWFQESPYGDGVEDKFMASEYWLMALSRVCDSVMQNEYITSTIHREKFDLVVLDNIDYNLCFMMIPYKFDIPFVSVYTFQTSAWRLGVTGMPSIEPEVVTSFSNKMTFWQRIDNLYSWLDHYNDFFSDLYSDHHMNKYCPAHKPKIPFKELKKQAEINLMNFEIFCLDYPRVSASNLQYLGGTTSTPVKPLPEELDAFVGTAQHGIVLMTLGSWSGYHQIMKVIGNRLFEAFAKLPQRVLLQYRLNETYWEVPSNVKLLKWLPQNDLLGHPKTKLFINHGGNNGQNEAAYHGVPMLVIPMLNDQIYNGVRVESHGFGKYVKDRKTITAEELYQMMSEIINNETYSRNIKKCSAILRSMPSAQEKFVFWVNHVLQFGGAHLRPPSLDMPLYQVLMLDILAYYVVMGLAVFHLAIFLVYLVYKHFIKNQKFKAE